jgi:hypothetical protein
VSLELGTLGKAAREVVGGTAGRGTLAGDGGGKTSGLHTVLVGEEGAVGIKTSASGPGAGEGSGDGAWLGVFEVSLTNWEGSNAGGGPKGRTR